MPHKPRIDIPLKVDWTEAARYSMSIRRFRNQILEPEALGIFDRESWTLKAALGVLIDEISTGVLSQQSAGWLAEFIRGVREAEDQKIGRALIGLPPVTGAPRNDVLWHEAVANYEHWVDIGHTDAEALRLCWETLYPNKDYAVEVCRPQGDSNAYDQQLKKIKVKLNSNGSRQRPAKGRKRIEKPG